MTFDNFIQQYMGKQINGIALIFGSWSTVILSGSQFLNVAIFVVINTVSLASSLSLLI